MKVFPRHKFKIKLKKAPVADPAIVPVPDPDHCLQLEEDPAAVPPKDEYYTFVEED